MATTTTLSQPALLINSVDYSDQCTSAVVTINFEQLEQRRLLTAHASTPPVSATIP